MHSYELRSQIIVFHNYLMWNEVLKLKLKKINNTKQLDQKHEVILKCETINLPCTVVQEAWFKYI